MDCVEKHVLYIIYIYTGTSNGTEGESKQGHNTSIKFLIAT